MTETPLCLICRQPLASPVVMGIPDFPGDTTLSPGQTLTWYVPMPYNTGQPMRCQRCGIDYRVPTSPAPGEKP